MWRGRSDALAPLTALTSNTAKWQWTAQHQQAFERLKTIVTKDVLLRFPDFAKPFDIYMDASDHQLGAVITQDNQPIAFYSRKLNDAQKRYTTTERELLAIVETLKEFRPILWGQRIRVFTDHKNLTCKNFNTDRVLRWRLLLEEYGPELYYHPGENNIVADALSRLDLLPDDNVPATATLQSFLELATFNAHLCAAHEVPAMYPLAYARIAKLQQSDDLLQRISSTDPHYSHKIFRGGGTAHELIVYMDKIVLPKTLRIDAVMWYHYFLCHPGAERTEKSMSRLYWWPNMRKLVRQLCAQCPTCQKTKKSLKKYGHVPVADAEMDPWEILCVDLIGPYTIHRKKPKSL